MTLSRRSFFTGIATLIAAPAIVRAESLMKLAPTEIIRATVEDYVLFGTIYIRPEWSVVVPDFPISLDEYSERILSPMVNQLEQGVADAVMNGESAVMIDAKRMYSVAAPSRFVFSVLETKNPWAEATNSHE